MSSVAEPRRTSRTIQRQALTTRGAKRPRSPYIDMNGATMVSIAAIALTVIGLLYLIQTSQVAQFGYDMSRQQTQRENLGLEISELKHELARYEALQTVEHVAVQRLGMTQLTNYEFIEVNTPAQPELELSEPRRPYEPNLFERVRMSVLGIGFAESPESSSVREREVRR